jgi:predicted S18 family serine protease
LFHIKEFKKYLLDKFPSFQRLEQDKYYIDFVYETRDALYIAELKPYSSKESYRGNLSSAIGQVIRYSIQHAKKLNTKNKPVILQIVMKGYESPAFERLLEFENSIEQLVVNNGDTKYSIKLLIDAF